MVRAEYLPVDPGSHIDRESWQVIVGLARVEREIQKVAHAPALGLDVARREAGAVVH